MVFSRLIEHFDFNLNCLKIGTFGFLVSGRGHFGSKAKASCRPLALHLPDSLPLWLLVGPFIGRHQQEPGGWEGSEFWRWF